jgi:hypothetical protein
VFEPATPRFKDGLHFTKSGGVACQRNRRMEVMDAVMLHSPSLEIFDDRQANEANRLPFLTVLNP